MNGSVAEDYRGEEMSRISRAVYGTVLTVMSLCGLFGSTVVLSVLWKDVIHRLASASCKVYIVSLVISDLYFQTYAVPLAAVGLFRGRYPALNELHCRLTGSGSFVSLVMFNCMAVLISVDRYVRIFHGAVYTKHFSVRNSVLVSVAVWIGTALFTVPIALGDRMGFNTKIHSCLFKRSLEFSAESVSFVVFMSVVCLGLVIPNILIFKEYKKNRQRVAQWQMNPPNSEQTQRMVQTSDVALLKSLLVILLCFVVLTVPMLLILKLTSQVDMSSDIATLALVFLGLNTSTNWLLLAVFNKRFLESYKALLCKR